MIIYIYIYIDSISYIKFNESLIYNKILFRIFTDRIEIIVGAIEGQKLKKGEIEIGVNKYYIV